MILKYLFFCIFIFFVLFNANILDGEELLINKIISSYEVKNVSLDAALYTLSVKCENIPLGFASISTNNLKDISLVLTNKSVKEIVNKLLESKGEFSWQEKKGVINVLINDKNILEVLNKPINSYECTNGNKISIIEEISKKYLDNMIELEIGNDVIELEEIEKIVGLNKDAENLAQSLAREITDRYKSNKFSHKYNFNFKNVTFVDILNYIVKEDKNYMWILWKENKDSVKMFLTFVKIDDKFPRYADKLIEVKEIKMIDKILNNFKVKYKSIFDICYELGNQVEDLSVGLEILSTEEIKKEHILTLENTSVRKILDNIIKIYPDYDWYQFSNIICIKPKKDVNGFSDIEIENVNVCGFTFQKYLDLLINLEELKKFNLAYSFSDDLKDRKLYSTVNRISFRNMLNNTIAKYNDIMWVMEKKIIKIH